MDIEIIDIENPELKKIVSELPSGRLRDYYRNFIILHERIIKSFQIFKDTDEWMRQALLNLCKVLFHEILGGEADLFYRDKGADGNDFMLAVPNAKDMEEIIFCITNNNAYRKQRKLIEKDCDFHPQGEILQIAAAIAEKKKYGSKDLRYKRFDSVYNSFFKYTSRSIHGSADIDRPKFSLTGKMNDYESFVNNILVYFKDDFSIPLQVYISSATKTDFLALRQYEEELRLLANKTTTSLIDRLNEEINSMYSSPLVLISPANVDDKILHGLARIPWNLIITFDSKGEDEDHLVSVIRKDWEGKRPFSIGRVESDGRDETCIVFANGDSINGAKTIYKEWRPQYENKVRLALNSIRKGSERIFAVCLTDGADNKVYNKGGIGLLEKSDSVAIIGKIGNNLKEGLDEEFSVEQYQNFDISVQQCIYALNEIDILGMNENIKVSYNLSAEDIKRYASHGIRIICPITSGTEKETNPISSFFVGKEITEKDLYNDYDVRRTFYEVFRRTIEARLDNGMRFTHYLIQTPSCGATTVGMRLAYDIATLSERGHFKTPVTSIFISELKSETVNPIVERIKDLAIKISPNHLLAFVDRSIQSSDFERMQESLIDGSSLKISFIRISEKEKGKPEYTSSIDDVIKKTELPDFVKIYRKHAVVMSNQENYDWNLLRHVIEFPLSLNYSDGKNINIMEYVASVLRKFLEVNRPLVQKLISLIGFSSEYIVNTDNYVEGYLFNQEIGKRFTEWYKDDLTVEERNAFERLIKFEEKEDTEKQRTGRVKTRFSKYNKDLIRISNLTLTALAISYIEIFFSEVRPKDKLLNDYIINLFFKKEEYEDDNSGYTGKSENQKFYKKLSSIFNDIHDPDSIELIIKELEKYVGDNPRFLMAKAQYIYNRAYFVDSEEHDSKVFDEARDILEKLLDESAWSQDNDSITFQSLGVVNYRRLGALRKEPVKNESLLPIAEKYISEVVKYCDKAYSANPYDTHALVTKAQALKSFLNFTREALGYDKDDFKFCETDKYLDWTAQYEATIDTISGFVANLDHDNTTVSQNQLLNIYDELRRFSFKLIGYSQEYIYDLYKQELTSRKIGNELKKIYVNRLFNVMVEAPNDEIRSGKIGMLSDEKLRFIEQQLVDSIKLGNLSGYGKVFRLHLFNGRNKFVATKEIQWLKDWINKDDSPLSQLWGNYYIGSLYFSEIIKIGFDHKGFQKSADNYISEAQRFAKILKRNDTKDFFYFRKGEGLQCITENSNKATLMEGYIADIIENRKGIAILDCGLKATFSPQGKFLKEDADKHTRIKAKVGFRFSGLGLYGLERIKQKDNDSDVCDNSERSYSTDTETSLQVIGKDVLPERTKQPIELPKPKEDNDNDSEEDEQYTLEEGWIFPGTYHNNHGKEMITGDWKEKRIKYLTIEGSVEDGIYDEAEVEFSVEKRIDKNNGREIWVAVNVKFPPE